MRRPRPTPSWSRLPMEPEARRVAPRPEEVADAVGSGDAGPLGLLPFGAGRSYGDTCVNSGGTLLPASRLNRILDFDGERGRLRCEAGVTLAEIHARTLPEGWVVPSCPGTAHVTVGGMVAHDVHGKNHGLTGTIGRHVRGLRLVRSVDGVMDCSPASNADVMRATLGGLGLTGFIAEVELQLMRCPGRSVLVERMRFRGLDETIAALEGGSKSGYAFAWVDSFSVKGNSARCVLTRARDADAVEAPQRVPQRVPPGAPRPGAGRWIPAALFRPAAMRAFNRLYFRGPSPLGPDLQSRLTPLTDFLFPQDTMHPSNHLYGRRGVYGHHSLVPDAEGVRAVLERVSRRGDQSLVTVLKAFGDHRAPGLLSFTGPGISIATGFRNGGERTLGLLADLDAIVLERGGKLYPAKDARMPREAFHRSFPAAADFARHVDPAFASNFWRRVA